MNTPRFYRKTFLPKTDVLFPSSVMVQAVQQRPRVRARFLREFILHTLARHQMASTGDLLQAFVTTYDLHDVPVYIGPQLALLQRDQAISRPLYRHKSGVNVPRAGRWMLARR